MTWQVPGAKVDITEFHSPSTNTTISGVRLEVGGIVPGGVTSGYAIELGSDTALALAAALVDAAGRCDERKAADRLARERAARQVVGMLQPDARG